MDELIKQIKDFQLLQAKTEEDNKRERADVEKDMKILKLERGMESLQERIKIKDDIIDDLKDIILLLKGPIKKPEEKKAN